GVVGPVLALALVLGANLGGAIAPLTALTGSPVTARRVPLGNLLARGVVGIAIVPILPWAVTLMGYISDDPGRLVLNFHTGFNILVAAIFLPLLTWLSRFVTWALPVPPDAPDRAVPQHLENSVLDTPSEALGCAMRETLRVGDIVL